MMYFTAEQYFLILSVNFVPCSNSTTDGMYSCKFLNSHLFYFMWQQPLFMLTTGHVWTGIRETVNRTFWFNKNNNIFGNIILNWIPIQQSTVYSRQLSIYTHTHTRLHRHIWTKRLQYTHTCTHTHMHTHTRLHRHIWTKRLQYAHTCTHTQKVSSTSSYMDTTYSLFCLIINIVIIMWFITKLADKERCIF